MNTNFSKIFKKPIYNFFITVYSPDSLTARKTKRKTRCDRKRAGNILTLKKEEC